MTVAILRAVRYTTRVMPLIGGLILIISFIVGTLASGLTRRVGYRIGWGILALLAPTGMLPVYNILLSNEPILRLWVFVMWGAAVAAHLAVSAFVRYARRSFELTRNW